MTVNPEATVAAGWPVRAAAERVGVSVSTLRSWEVRYGLGPQGRTAGGHRRYTAADVARLQRLHRLVRNGVPTGTAAAAVQEASAGEGKREPVNHADRTRAAERLRALVDAFDAVAAERLATRLLDEHGTVTTWSQIFTPVLQGLGRRWQVTGAGIECEHLAADVIRSALVQHQRHRRGPADRAAQRAGALLAAADGEGHTLPLRALAAALAEYRVASTVLDGLPVAALQAAVEQSQPAALVVYARSRDTADARALRGLVAAVPLLCAGGIGWPARLPVGGTRAPDLATALDLIRAATGHAVGRR